MKLRRNLLTYCLVAALFFVYASTVSAAEIQLAGIKLGTKAENVLKKYGVPQEVRVGAVQSATLMGGGMTAPTLGAPTASRFPGAPMGGGMGASMAAREAASGPALMRGAGMGNNDVPLRGEGIGPGGRPIGAMGGGMAPAMIGGFNPPAGGAMRGQSATQVAGPPEVTWTYRFSKNRTLEFLINPKGLVVQIAAYGSSWSGLHTARGIGLGSTYKDVVLKYGFPELHEEQGIQLVAKYENRYRQHVAFTMVGRTVVGITIAL